LYLVEYNNVLIAQVATIFGRHDHHQATFIPNLKRLVIYSA